MSCAVISLSTDGCNHTRIAGTVPVAYVFNLKDIAGYDSDNFPTMVGGKTGWVIKGFTKDVMNTTETISLGLGPDVFKHTVGVKVYEQTQAAKDSIIKPLVQGKTVWIIERNGKNGNSFQLIGKSAGLVNVPGVINNPHENVGAWIMNLATDDGNGEFEDDAPKTVYVTSYAASLAAIEALVTQPPTV